MTQNQIAYHNARELQRHNIATELETARHQSVQEQLQNTANKLSHESNIIQKDHYERMDAINATHYSNLDSYNAAYLAELQRTNQANEALKAQQNAINAASILETARHQQAQEGIESRLASNTIYRTQKEMSLIAPQADYIRAQTKAQWANWSKSQAEERYTYAQEQYLRNEQSQKTQADTKLTQTKVGTEKSSTFLNVTSGVQNIVSTWQKLLSGFGVSVKF